MKEHKTILKGLEKFVDERDIKKVRSIVEHFHVSDIYKEIENWPIEKSVLLLHILTKQYASELFGEFTPKQQTKIIDVLTSDEIAKLFKEMYVDEAIDILEELPSNIAKRIIASTTKEQRNDINKILRYGVGKVGYHMVIEYVSITNGITILQAKEIIKNQINKEELEIIGNIFVVDKETDEFIGYIKPDIIIAGDDLNLVDNNIERMDGVLVSDHITKAQDLLSQYDVSSAPVIDSNNKLIGIIEAEDIIERYEDIEESIFDATSIATINKTYFDVTLKELILSRMPWIITLLIIGSLSQIVILGFQSIWIQFGLMINNNSSDSPSVVTFSSIGILAVTTALSMVPSITGTAGNVGSQTSTTLIRAIALNEVTKNNSLKALIKELKVSTIIGLVAFFVSFLRIIIVWSLFGKFSNIQIENGHNISEIISWMMLIAFIASFSFFLTIIIGSMVGSGLATFSERVGFDGAVIAGPVQTTILDIATIIIYFSITSIIFVPLASHFNITI